METEMEEHEHEPKERNLCVVCGARVMGSWADTCDSTCTRAKKSNLTRGQQMREDMRRSAYMFRENLSLMRMMDNNAQQWFEDEHYNNPWLRLSYAG